jgi:flagellar hook-length control protein FliK
VLHAIRVSLSREGDRVTVQLQPAGLGKVELMVAREGGELAAHFRVETPEAHQALLAEAPALRNALEAKGISLIQVSVDLEGRADDRGGAPGRGRRAGRRPANGSEGAPLESSSPAPGWRPWGFEARV